METAIRMQPLMPHQQITFNRNDRKELNSLNNCEANGQEINPNELQRFFNHQGQDSMDSCAVTSPTTQNGRHRQEGFSNNSNVIGPPSDFFHNKRVSGDMMNHTQEFTGERWPHLPNRFGCPDELQNQRNLQKCAPQNNNPGAYPNNAKRLNVGRMHFFPPPPHPHQAGAPANASLMQNPQSMQFPVTPLQLPPPSMFTGNARPEMVSFRPQLASVGPRLPFQPGLPQASPQPPKMHPNQQDIQQQNFFFNGPMGPPPSENGQVGKRSRFMRTAQILQQSGLMDVTMKTAALMRENASIQRDIDALFMEVNHLINQQQFAATQAGMSTRSNDQFPPMLQQQDFPSPLQFNQQMQPTTNLTLDY